MEIYHEKLVYIMTIFKMLTTKISRWVHCEIVSRIVPTKFLINFFFFA
jgi:hypothetical protein